MSGLKKNWKLILALLLLIAAALVYFLVYRAAQTQYENDKKSVENQIQMMQMLIQSTQERITASEASIEANRKYEPIQEQIEEASKAIDLSRAELYEKFPVELREEDQIMYVLYLEQLFGTEITFKFGSADLVTFLSDGAALGGLTLTVNYETTYQGFKDMITYLATDSRITSIRNSTLSYDHENDRAVGDLTLLCYLLQPDGYSTSEYIEPPVEAPEETGKPNIFH